MSLPPHLEALREEALRTSCISWAIRKRWTIAPTGHDRAGPCPVCGGKDRFSIQVATDLFNCRKCEMRGQGVIDLVMATESVDFTKACEIITGRSASAPVDEAAALRAREANAAEAIERGKAEAAYREEARQRGYDIWAKRARPVDWSSSPVADYLALRGIAYPEFDMQRLVLKAIDKHRWIEKQGELWVTVHEGPAMIAAVQRPDGTFGAVHQTWLDPNLVRSGPDQPQPHPKGRVVLQLTPDGKERPSKKVLGTKKGGAIRLFTPEKPRRIVMGEGIETTLTALAHNFEYETAYWAGVDLGNMAGKDARAGDGSHLWDQPDLDDRDCFLPPDWCEDMVYLCDDDEPRNHTEEKVIRGLRRARVLRDMAREKNPALASLTVSYVPPLGDGKDLNDLVRVA